MPPEKPGHTVLSKFFDLEEFGLALADNNISQATLIEATANVMRSGKTDQGKLAAIRLLQEQISFFGRLGRVYQETNDRTLSYDETGRLHVSEVNRPALEESVRRTEDALRQSLESPAAVALLPPPTVDAEAVPADAGTDDFSDLDDDEDVDNFEDARAMDHTAGENYEHTPD